MNVFFDRFKYGKETIKDPLFDNPDSYGRIELNGSLCNSCGACKEECIVGAVDIFQGKVIIDEKKCIYCGNCINACKAGALKNTHDYRMAVLEAVENADSEAAGLALKNKIYKNFGRSLVLRSVDTGSCNACMLELSATQNTFYSLSRYGIDFAASPRHADGIVVTGPVTINMKEALLKTYYAMSEPRLVIAVGTCAYDGGIFKDAYGNFERLDKLLRVDLVVPGCPPSPQAIIYGLNKLIK
ncbi:MAG: NADH-quinone oxidoreductase subunit NuoB [Bacillota bacterium]|nr:NADH-quinone oxidoreductase subunit NuoB [Bacillota bacterium]